MTYARNTATVVLAGVNYQQVNRIPHHDFYPPVDVGCNRLDSHCSFNDDFEGTVFPRP
jgi:hypothetical protein